MTATFSAFVENLRKYSGLERNWLAPKQNRSVLVLPRGKKENWIGNERTMAELDILCKWVEDGRYPGASTFHSDAVTDVRVQVKALAHARVIFVSYGSAMFFNAALARNATVHVLGHNFRHHEIFPALKAMWAGFAGSFNKLVVHERMNESALLQLIEEEIAV